MPRPKSRRFIHEPPLFDSFKPVGVRARDLQDLEMSLDELEALRLADKEGMTQDEAAEKMAISRSTFSRLVESARKKSAEFLLEGRRLSIGGGPVHFRQNRLKCRNCGQILVSEIGREPKKCTNCGSTDLVNLADGYGHGESFDERFSSGGGGRRHRGR